VGFRPLVLLRRLAGVFTANKQVPVLAAPCGRTDSSALLSLSLFQGIRKAYELAHRMAFLRAA